MACRFKFIPVVVILSLFASGCLSLRVEKASIGNAAPGPSQLKENRSTLQDALKLYGAPGDIIEMEGRIALIYEKGFYTGTQLSLGIPVFESVGPDLNLSGYGRLWRYDRLALFFSPDWVLMRSVYVKGSQDPFLQSLFRDKEPENVEKGPEKQGNIQRPLEP
ncbi:MAG: hypothetical protein ABFD62_13240 [Syntrophaceae bacterium]